MRVQLDPLPSDRHTLWTSRGTAPLIPPPLGTPPAPPAADASAIERDAYAFLRSFTVNGELRLRRRGSWIWVRVDGGMEEVSNRYDVTCRVYKFFAQHVDDDDREEMPAKRHLRAVVDAVMRLAEAPSADPTTLTAELLACRFLAYHAPDNLRHDGRSWIDTVCQQDADLPLRHVRALARRFIAAVLLAEGVDGKVTQAQITAVLASARAQSTWLQSMTTVTA